MYIRTFEGRSTDDLPDAIRIATEQAQALLLNLNKEELVSIQSQSIADIDDMAAWYTHIITVVYE